MFRMLIVIFLAAIFVRFLYFPENIYFGFDQARDAFAAADILKGDLKIVGPPTSVEGLYHGVLYYYIMAPIYFFGKGNPEIVSMLMRIFNAAGVFMIFYIATSLFNKRVAILSALLFAVSFEQTQFSIYMGNPSLATLSVMLMYLGLALVIFKKKKAGLPLAVLGLGFSIQFQFALSYLIVPFLLLLIIFRKSTVNLSIKTWGISFLILLISLSTFILAELKYNFRSLHSLNSLSRSEKDLNNIIETAKFTVSRMGKYNLTGDFPLGGLILLALFLVLIFLLIKKSYLNQVIFLMVWFFSIFATLLISGGVGDVNKNVPLYYPNVGVSTALLIFIAFLLGRIFTRSILFGAILTILVIYLNLILIGEINPKGTISEINVQQGMLLYNEKKVMDYMYNESNGELFAVKGVTMPFLINTTWSYLFESYGKNKYGYLPVWNGKNAQGFPGHLSVEEAQEKLPKNRFLVIEPLRGIAPHLSDEYLREENYFTKVVEEKKFGEFVVQKREKF